MKHIHCPHFKLCSGCSLNEFVDNPPVLTEAKDFFLKRGLSLSVHSGNVIGWRNRAKLAVRGTVDEPLIGLYQEGTHNLIAIPFCKVHHPHINSAVEMIRQIIQEEKIKPYDEKSFQGVLRYLQLVVERKTGKVQLTLVLNCDITEVFTYSWLQKLWKKGSEKLWHSIWINENRNRTNTIFDNQWELIDGEEFLWESFDGTAVCFHPASFAQANLDLFEKMIKTIKSSISNHSNLVEYYAGVGVLSLCLVDQFEKITCCEITPSAKSCFEQARAMLKADQREKIHFYVGLAEKNLNLMEEADVVIVDPPRKGLDPLVTEKLKSSKLKEIIYISCGWDSFQRDCDILLSSGWKMTQADAFLFFPGSNHLETLTFFQR